MRNAGGLDSDGSSARGKMTEGFVLKIVPIMMFLSFERKRAIKDNIRFVSLQPLNRKPITNMKNTEGKEGLEGKLRM